MIIPRMRLCASLRPFSELVRSLKLFVRRAEFNLLTELVKNGRNRLCRIPRVVINARHTGFTLHVYS
jgi:hypothetical protein